ncbi:M14 family metallopeptidase [Paraflavitalea sp. CAU 1676]|uniref:M14 family metallopeptidase n=1 Tax=Paraflavitalea sp. CAU 1676 TaxID=3032598 RepID=UPI0023DC0326|nr:M14 family metallopeptidase [Paraflavitalea sp. CAU 1676]MDF2187742.1 M14 family metallopeptidase [Paraflavitalea sp. CAU 1676]
MRKQLTAILLALVCGNALQAQQDYAPYQQQTSRIQALTKQYPQLASVKSIAHTQGNKEVWMLTIGSGNTGAKPAIAIVGGVEGNHLLGTELAIGFAEDLLKGSTTDSIKALLAKTTFYVFPNMSPDATEQYFAALKFERQGNATTTDDDRDGKTDEDSFDDLDGNGKITWVRVESPLGEYKLHPDDPRVLIKADVAKGEKGKYLLIAEGIDNDKDNQFNEDGPGGVWFNKNFTYKHPSFTQGAGEYAVSEKETRAITDQLFDLFNIYAVVSFSSNNNLSTPIAYNAAAANQRIVAGYIEADAKANALVSELYNKVTGMKEAPKANAAGGDFLSWGYYHYARYSFSTPGWFVPKAKADTAKKEKALTVDDPVANYLRWAAQQGITNTFTPWKAIQHPDFEGRTAEVGGIDPYVLINPPYKLVPEIVKKHTSFVVQLAGYQPELDILNVKTEKLGNGLTRISLDVANKGLLASHTKLGERSYWIKRIQVKVNTGGNQSVISGRKTQLLNTLDGLSSQPLTWLVKGSGKITIEAGSPTTGTVKTDINL